MNTPEPEVDVDVVTHWGNRMAGGNIRWDPQYGAGPGMYPPFDEAEARADAKATGGTVVTRTETTVTITTPWVDAPAEKQ